MKSEPISFDDLIKQLAIAKNEAATYKTDLFELWKLVDDRPADNAGLAENYTKWNGLVYSLSILQAMDKREAGL